MRLLLIAILLVASNAMADGGWVHRGFKQGMSFPDFLTHAVRFGRDEMYLSDPPNVRGARQSLRINCEKNDSCRIGRPGGDTLSFTFCAEDRTLKDIWYSPDGQTLGVFADALEELKSSYGAEVVSLSTEKTHVSIGTGQVASTTITASINTNQTAREGWWISVSVSGYESRYKNLSTRVRFNGTCH